MDKVVHRIIRKFTAGKEKPEDTVVFPIWDKEAKKEIVLRYGVDAREYLERNPGRYTSKPPAGKESPQLVVIHAEEEVIEKPSLPEVDTEHVMEDKTEVKAGVNRSKNKNSEV